MKHESNEEKSHILPRGTAVSGRLTTWADHRTLYKKQLYTLDVLFRKLCRSIVTPPSDTDWSLERHEILHRWNDRARTFTQTAGLQPWSCCVCRQHWKLASHIANLPEHRLVRRILAWNPSVGPWLEEAKYHHHWNALFEDFYTFCQMWEQFEISCETNVHISFHRLCPKWARLVAYRHWPLTIDHCRGLGWQRVAETSTDIQCWRWQARTIFWFMGCPCDKNLQVAEYWGVAGRSPGQSSLAAVPAGFCHICAFVIFVGLTPCALNRLPHHGIQVQSQSQSQSQR